MTDSIPDEPNLDETPTEEKRFFSSTLLMRLLAVALFVVLGTFAVIQSLGKTDGHDHANDKETDPALVAKNGVQTKLQSAGESAGKLASQATLGLAGNEADPNKETKKVDLENVEAAQRIAEWGLTPVKAAIKQRRSPVTTAGFQRPTTGGVNAPKTSGFTATTKPATTLRRNTTATKPIKAPPIVTTAKPSTQTGIAKPPTGFPANSIRKPPERFAQLGGPTAGSSTTGTTGFTASAKPPVQQPRVDGLLKNAVDRTSQGLSGIKNTATQATSDLVNRAKSGASNAATNLQNKASQFGESLRPDTSSPFKATGSPTARKTGGVATGSNTMGSGPIGRPSSTGQTTSPFRSSPMQPLSKAGPASTSTPGSSASPFNSLGPRGNTPSMPASTTRSTTQLNRTPAARAAPAQTQLPRQPIGNQSASNSRSTSRQDLPGSRSFSDQQPPRGRTPVTRPSETAGSNALGGPIASVAARNTPGDRSYEGVQAPALTIEKVSPREIQVNQIADFEVVVKNVGRVTADEVRVIDKVPAGTQYIGSNPEPSSLGRTGDLQWSLGTMRPGQEKRIRYQLKPTKPGEIGSVAQVVIATRASMRTVVTEPILEIRHATEPRVLIGDNVVFDVIVENKGSGPANEVIIQEEIPSNLEFSDGSPEIEYEIGTLMPGQSRRVQLGLRAAKVGKVRNVMFASAKGGLSAQHELDLEVIAPLLKTGSKGPVRRYLQREVTHQFTIENGGTAKATNVELFARLPSGLRFVSANNRGKYDSNTHSVVWVMPELTQGVAGTVELTTMPVEAGDQNILFESFADLGLKSETKQPLNVEHLVDVFFDIDDVIDPIEIGAATSYKIRIVNQGTKTASNVQIQVTLPPGLQPTGVDGSLRNEIQGQRVVFEPISTMRPGDELGVTVRAVGKTDGDHRVVVNLRSDGRDAPVSKEETTRVYSDR